MTIAIAADRSVIVAGGLETMSEAGATKRRVLVVPEVTVDSEPVQTPKRD